MFTFFLLLSFGSLIIKVPFGVKKTESGYFDLSDVAGIKVVVVGVGDLVVKGLSSVLGATVVLFCTLPVMAGVGGDDETVGFTLPSSSFDI